jgi:uncharacterized protein (UPF0128 family)
MKTYQIKELQKELAKRNRMIEAIKVSMNREGIPAWSKNNLIKEHNLHVRVAKSIREQLLEALA